MFTARQTLCLLVTVSLSTAVGLSCGSVRARNPNASQNFSGSETILSTNPNTSISTAANQELLSQSLALSSSQVDAATKAKVQRDFGKMPLYFIENRGQLDKRVSYYVQGKNISVYFTPEGLTYVLNGTQNKKKDSVTGSKNLMRQVSLNASETNGGAETAPQRRVLKLDFVGANRGVKPKGVEQNEAVISYFKGPKEQWKTGLKTYNKIVYEDLWPGIDLVYNGNVNKMKYEFVVKPGADPKQIKLAYRGVEFVKINDAGQLEVRTPVRIFHDDTPHAYQEIDRKRVAVSMAYQIEPTLEVAQQRYSFRVGAYDKTEPLVLDPAVFVYVGFIGGDGWDEGHSIALDTQGNVYVTGFTFSTQTTFPVAAGPSLKHSGTPGNSDVFVAKVKADGTGLVYAGFIGGAGDDTGLGIAVDGQGNAYLTGRTGSFQDTFPVKVGPDLTSNAGDDAFVTKVNASGTDLIYCGYIGGGFGFTVGYGIAVDNQGNAYVTGTTSSSLLPVTVGPGLVKGGGYADAFVAKVKADGTGLVYAGYIGGTGDDQGRGIALDAQGSAYIVGYTNSSHTSFPVTVGPDLTYNGLVDAFVAKVKADGTGLLYAGYIGGSGDDYGYGIALDHDGNAYIVGTTSSNEATFPVKVGPDLIYHGGDAFVAKVKADGTGLVYAGYIGGDVSDYGYAIAVDARGYAYLTGSAGRDFPAVGGPSIIHSAIGLDAFVAKVKLDGSGLVYCGFIGGVNYDEGFGIAVDNQGNTYVVGTTDSTETTFPVKVGPDLTYNSFNVNTSPFDGDAFVAKITEIADAGPLAAAVLPSSRSVQIGATATAFATIINAGSTTATGCGISVLTGIAANFSYQATDPATNQVTGSPNTPVDIAPGAARSFIIFLTPTAPLASTDVQFSFSCANTNPAGINSGLNTLLFSASATPIPDIVALAATTTNDGIVNIPGTTGTGAFAVATVNVGASGNITTSADTGSTSLPVVISLCQTNPVTGQCISVIGPTVTTIINANATPTFGIFVTGVGNVSFDPAMNRIFVRFRDGGGVTRGATSVAVRTQ